MTAEPQHEVTRLLQRIDAGEADASGKVYELVYDELKRLAHRQMRREDPAHTLQTTALVHEAWLRLSPKEHVSWRGRAHFLQAAAGTMRTILVDHARRKKACKRSAPGERIALDEALEWFESRHLDVLALSEALDRLREVDAPLARIVELRLFGGLTVGEIAEVLSASVSTVERGWRTARAWMVAELGE